MKIGTLNHEILHALGISHDHQRSDRDKFVKVLLYENTFN